MPQSKIALIADDVTRLCLSHECQVLSITPWNYAVVFKLWRPDLLFVESAWQGRWGSWRYRIASYPEFPERTNRSLTRVVTAAREAGIPAVFWNREDDAHFDRFIGSARLFDRVLTVDRNMVPRYQELLTAGARIDVMMFAAQPAFHFPTGEEPARRAAFVGSYSQHTHFSRKAWQDRMFQAAEEISLTVYDRNSDRRSGNYRYPERPWIEVRNAVPHTQTGSIYRSHAVNLNVNTITGSPTAFSRRLVEILACGGYMLSNPTEAVDQHFRDFCVATDDAEEARSLFARIASEGLSPQQREQARAGADYVKAHHTWRHRLAQIMEMAG